MEGLSNFVTIIAIGSAIGLAILNFLYKDKKKWELESARQTTQDLKTGNEELRNQLKDAEAREALLKQERHGLQFQLGAKDGLIAEKESLIKELKDLARQVPAFTELSRQQREEHREVTEILGKVVQNLADLVSEIKKGNPHVDTVRRSKN